MSFLLTVMLLATMLQCSSNNSSNDTETTTSALTGPFVFTILLPPHVTAASLALDANDALSIDTRATVSTLAGASASVANTGANQTTVATAATVGNIWSVGPVTIASGATVNGFIRGQSSIVRAPGSTVTGAVIANTSLTPPDSVSWSVSFPATNGGDVNVSPSTTRTLAPGAFNNVAVSPSGILRLSSGTYFFQSLALHPCRLRRVVGRLRAIALPRDAGGTGSSLSLRSAMHTGAFFAKHIDLLAGGKVVQQGAVLPPAG